MQRLSHRVGVTLFLTGLFCASGCVGVLRAGGPPEDSHDYYGDNYDDSGFDGYPDHQGDNDPYDRYFQSRLQRYGDWISISGNISVWRPSVVASWAPYALGYWGRSGNDWVWISYEPFGDIVYHYGDWGYVEPYGWCWFPGRDWAPNHVDWVEWQGSIGWYPSRPRVSVNINFDQNPRWDRYIWVSNEHFLDKDFYRERTSDPSKRWRGGEPPRDLQRREVPNVSTVETWTGKRAPAVQNQEVRRATKRGDVRVFVPDQQTREQVRKDGAKIVVPWLSPKKQDKKQDKKQEKKP